MYLIDTNIFLEILLGQQNRGKCRNFLEDNDTHLHLSDFSLHSIGVICFRFGKADVFSTFAREVLGSVSVVTLPGGLYSDLAEVSRRTGLDFDDTYQYLVGESHGLKIVTMDKDFEKIKEGNVIFL